MLLHDRNEKSTVNNGASMLNEAWMKPLKIVIWTYGLFGCHISTSHLHCLTYKVGLMKLSLAKIWVWNRSMLNLVIRFRMEIHCQ
jgi:hypothetical protein